MLYIIGFILQNKTWYYYMGKCSKTYSNSVTVGMNDILRAFNFSSTYQNVNNLYNNFKLLKLQNIYRLELAKFLYKLEHNELPKSFNNNFGKITTNHKHGTRVRQATSSNYFLPRVGKKNCTESIIFKRIKIIEYN